VQERRKLKQEEEDLQILSEQEPQQEGKLPLGQARQQPRHQRVEEERDYENDKRNGMDIETAFRLVEEGQPYIPFGSRLSTMSIRQWPVEPFEPIDYYLDFQIGDNLYASEKASELTIERFFDRMDTLIWHNKRRYEDWKKKEIRDWKIKNIIG
jgi:hypothetical protein